jgi:hypothetical protein
MCWSATASIVLGTAGVATAAYAHTSGESKYVTLPLVYFSLMEFLQFFSYATINECALTANSSLTLLSYIHIAFQPLFVNMFLMYSLKKRRPTKRTRALVYTLCFITSGILLIKLIPLDPTSLCALGQTLCGATLCTVSGTWHLAWSVPQYNWPIPFDSMVYYSLAAFVLPLWYGARGGAVRTVLSGPVLAYILTAGNPLEWPAVWCLYSVLLIIMTLLFQHQNAVRSYLDTMRAHRT